MKHISRRSFLKAAGLTTVPMTLTMSGCGSASSSEEATASSATSSQATSETTKDGRIGNGTEGFTYWTAINGITAGAYTDLNEHPFSKYLETVTGVNVDFISPAIGQEKEQMNLMLGSMSDLPDAIRYDVNASYKGGVDSAVADGVIIDATPLIEQFAPNFMRRINEHPDTLRDAYTDSGIVRNFGGVIPDPDLRGLPFQGPLVDKALLDKAGLSIPETIADWEVMLEAFKEMGVTPFSFGCNKTFNELGNFGAFSGAFGVPMGPTYYRVENKVHFGPVEEGYKEFLQTFAKWYKNGWLDPDFLSKHWQTDVSAEFESGMLGSVIGHINLAVTAPISSAKQGIPEVVAVPVPYPVVKKGDTPHFRQHIKNFNAVPMFITSAAKNPELIVKWIDYLYSDEGANALTWGTKGDSNYPDCYYVDENGQKRYTDYIMANENGMTQKEAQRQLLFADVGLVWSWENHLLIYEDPREREGWDVWGAADYSYEMPTSITLTPEEAEDFSKGMSDITTYVNQMSSKFIMGIESFDKYDAFLSTLKDTMKIDKLIAIQQTAMDRYMQR